MKKDSVGNPLPDSIYLPNNANAEQIGVALALNTFLLAAEVAMSKGDVVIYDAETKKATIDTPKGTIFIFHA